MRLPFTYLLIVLLAATVISHAQEKGVYVTSSPNKTIVMGDTYAIIIGVSNYPGIKPLLYADKDALLFRDFLTTPAGGSVKKENMMCLINDSAKAADFNVRAYSWLKRKDLKKGDRLFLYFSGHGDAMNEENYFLLPYDCMPNKDDNNYLATGNISMHTVKTLFIRPLTGKGVQVILIVDACRSNELPGGEQGQQDFVKNIQAISEENTGELLMLSTGAGQVSIESPKIGNGHGLFTWYLVDGLSGAADKEGDAADHAGIVSFAELSGYVKNRVKKDAQTLFHTTQIPVFLPPDKDQQTVAVVDSATYNNWTAAKKLDQMVDNENMFVVANKARGQKGVDAGNYGDTALISLDNKFIAALKNDKLIGDASADFYYTMMEKKWPDQSITKDAKYQLVTDFVNFCQEKINLYLSGNDDDTHINHITGKSNSNPGEVSDRILKMRKLASTNFDRAAYMMERCFTLLKNEPELLSPLYAKLYFLKAAAIKNKDNPQQSEFSEAISLCKKAIRIDDKAAYNYLIIGQLFEYTGNDSCVFYLKKAHSLAPKWARPLNALGDCYCDDDGVLKINRPLALHYYREAIKADNLNEQGYNNIGEVYLHENKTDSALFYYGKALDINSCNRSALDNIAFIYSDSIDYDSFDTDSSSEVHFFSLVKQILEKALTCDSTNLDAYYRLGGIYRDVHKIDSSINYFKKAIYSKTSTDSWAQAVSCTSLANIYFKRLMDTTNAEKYYLLGLKIDSSNANGLYRVIKFFYSINKPQKASMLIQRKLKVKSDPEILKTIGDAFEKIRPDSAIRYYSMTLKLRPDYIKNADFLDNLGITYLYVKNYKKGITYLKNAIELDKDNSAHYYTLACAYSLSHNSPNGFKYLQISFDKGYRDYENLSTDADLVYLRSLHEYKVLVKKYFPDKVK